MPYLPPSGFVESWDDDSEDPVRLRFHTRIDCPRVRNRDALRPVDRPYSAARCSGCADTYGENRESFTAPA